MNFVAGHPDQVSMQDGGAVDLPGFVANLIEGTFKVVVDGSIRQMNAYADLLRSVAKSVDQFSHDHVSSAPSREHPSRKMAPPPAPSTKGRQRKQRLAAKVLMGINRIVVTDGKINAKLSFRA